VSRFNPLQAQEWLAQAGYPDGKGFPEITLVCDKSEIALKVSRAVQKFLKHYLNINVKLDEKGDYAELLASPDIPHIFQYKACGNYPDADSYLYEFSQPDKIGWQNVMFAQITDSVRTNSDPEERKKLYKQAEQILVEDEAVVMPIYFETYPCLVKPRVKDWYHMAAGGQHIRNWRLEK